ncbi:MAG: epoxyqueuosine reductase QueH [PVC group bacterium]|nr:epoxyqueuosine reductase QueH [PVC group bacterium]
MSNKKVLLHACCGPCLIYPLEKLRSQGYEVTAFFYNPNIYPIEEYNHRRDCLSDYARQSECPVIVHPEYEDSLFFETLGEDTQMPKRCHKCWELRLRKTAQKAKESGCDTFSSTLMVSPYQNIELIHKIGDEIADETGIKFYFDNFRRGYQEAVKISKEKNMYRQNYCGCKFSLEEKNTI